MNPKSIITYVSFFLVSTTFAQAPINIKLNSATDSSQFILSKVKGKFVALHFLLKTECPFCIRHTDEYIKNAYKLPNVVQIFIKPDTKEEIKGWIEKIPDYDRSKFPIYIDPGAKLAAQYNIPSGYVFHDQIVNYPAMVLLGPDGREVYRYIGKNNSDRFSFEQLVTKISELTK